MLKGGTGVEPVYASAAFGANPVAFDFKRGDGGIGASTGAGVGLGATMLLPMDVRIASEQARFGFVFQRFNLFSHLTALDNVALGPRRVLGLPGNPASALVCAELFLKPLLAALSGGDPEIRLTPARLVAPLSATGPREHWMRARLGVDAEGRMTANPFPDQDSSLIGVFAQADALLRRGAAAPAGGARASAPRRPCGDRRASTARECPPRPKVPST